MHASASPTIVKLHRQSSRPLRFFPAATRALDALALSTPGISVDFDVDEGGDAYAVISRHRGQFVALVIAGTAGTTSIVDHTGATAATLGDDEAGIRLALRCAVERGGSAREP